MTRKGSRKLACTIEAHERSSAEVWGEAGRSSSKGGNNQERSDPSAGVKTSAMVNAPVRSEQCIARCK